MSTRSEKSGKLGENKTEKELEKLSSEYGLFCDLIIKSVRQSTAQIDFLIVSPYGVFVIEVKNYHGAVVEAEYKSKLMVINGDKMQVYDNPVYQNKWHLYALMQATGLKEQCFIPIAVYPSATKIDMPQEQTHLMLEQLLPYIQSYKQRVLSREQIMDVSERIKQVGVTEQKERKQHAAISKNKAVKSIGRRTGR